MLVPIPGPQDRQEARARSTVERVIGLLKVRWRCLNASGGRLLYHPRKVCKIIRTCVVLHNLAVRRGVPLPPGLHPPLNVDPDPRPPHLLAMRNFVEEWR